MAIRLSPTIEKRVARAAKSRGIKPAKLVENALKQYLTVKREPCEQISEFRKQLRALAQYKKKAIDSDAALHAARQYARTLEEDNAEFIEMAGKRFTKPHTS